jgi:phosphopantothenoylcysteine decarboxylase/phosphopantothenate--cysteine ligase
MQTEGQGRLPPIEDIMDEMETILTAQDLQDMRILVTAGPTREAIDPVRFITNYSSGKMGYALAIAGKRRGAHVTLISGPTALPVPRGVKHVSVSTAVEMRDAVMENMEGASVIIKAAAVADYRLHVRMNAKIKKREGELAIRLERNPDIIAEVGTKKGNRILVGFAVETENLMENAKTKLREKNMDIIVANDVRQVIVIDTGAHDEVCTFGSILILRARLRGIAGVVTDGCVRDLDEIPKAGLPVYAKGSNPIASKVFFQTVSVGEPVSCGECK